MVSPVVALITFVVFAVSFVPLAKWFIRRLKFIEAVDKFPGVKAYPLIGTAYLFFGYDRTTLHQLRTKMHTLYPYIDRQWIGPLGQVNLKKAEYAEKVLSSRKAHSEKGWMYLFVRPWLGEGLLTSHGDKWHQSRKIITPAFHFSTLEYFCEIMEEKSQVLVNKLQPKAASGEPFQIYPYITRAALDIITEAAMGTVVNAQENDDNAYVAAVYEATVLILKRVLAPWNHFERIYKLTSEGRAFAKCLSTMHGFTNNVIAQRRAAREQKKLIIQQDDDSTPKRRLAFLDLLLELNEQSQSNISNDEIRQEVDTFMFAGHDTTTTGISWVLYLLGRHPKVQEEVYAELESIFGGSDRKATIADLNEMNLLDRVIKETLRLYPSVPIIGRKTSEEIHLDQYVIPKDCNITIDIVSLHRDERYFPDPDRFDPDRFLPENAAGRHPFTYIPFSAGSRNCIGQKFAMYEEKIMLSKIVRNYRLTSVGKPETRVEELINKPLFGVQVVLEQRVR